ncbi:phage holin family protein [Methylotenera sp.]|uniref:phage holin family protein n=1 Tax=Methylotenera sp. TaxID=2051956 RepID=UPI0024877852|nr:phage holin family protein [Methylotenera sp.]MDI1361338.1 phage holin family protein [Methylotenera sp.]
MTNKTSTSSLGLFESVKALTSTLVAIIHTRLELLSTDLEEDRERLMSLVMLSLIALFSLLIAAVLVTITLVVAFWDSYRVLALASVSGMFIIIGVSTWLAAVHQAKKKPKMFVASLLELIKDRQHIDAK